MLNFYKDKRYVCDRIERLQYDLKMMSRMGPFAAINYIRHVIGYEEYLKEYAGFRRMNVEDLLEVLSDLQESARGIIPMKNGSSILKNIQKRWSS